MAAISLNDTVKSEFVKWFSSQNTYYDNEDVNLCRHIKLANSAQKANSAVRSGRVAHGDRN